MTAMAYWDTSCLFKLYAPEPDSTILRAHALKSATIVTSQITRLEIWAALQRKETSRDLQPGGARTALDAYDADVAAAMISVKPLDRAVVEKFEAIIEQSARNSPPLPLRTLDAIHLSTAAAFAESQIVATDNRLREAASTL